MLYVTQYLYIMILSDCSYMYTVYNIVEIDIEGDKKDGDIKRFIATASESPTI